MSEWFEIRDNELSVLKDQVILITGASSGMGLATVNLLLSLGAKVVAGDLNPTPTSHPNFQFQKTDVTSWTDLTSLFALTQSIHGRIDHVFANAGIGPNTSYLDLQTDSAGQLVEPVDRTMAINLRGVINTSALAFHYMKTQQPPGGSVVVTASGSSFQRFMAVDYGTAKHGVLGFMRGEMVALKAAGLPIRINAIAPSWTRTGLVIEEVVHKAGKPTQSADVPARSAAILMADESRNGHLIYSEEGKFKEIDEAVLLKCVPEIVAGEDDNVVVQRVLAIFEEMKREQETKSS